MDALLHVTRQVSKLDPNRLITNIHHIATGDSRAPSAWMSLFYDLKELEDVFQKLSHSGHDVRAAYRDFDDLRRWVNAAASTMSPRKPHPSLSPHSVPRSPHSVPRSPHPVPRSPHSVPVPPTQSASQRPPMTTSKRPEHARPRVGPTIPPSLQHHRPSKGHVIAPTPVRASSPPKHVHFAPNATVYTVSRYAYATPVTERPACVPRATRPSHTK